MDIGFIGLRHMGFPMANRLLDTGHDVVAFDTRIEALGRLAVRGELGYPPGGGVGGAGNHPR